MQSRFDDTFEELEPQLTELQATLDVTMFQFKRLLKRYCAEHK